MSFNQLHLSPPLQAVCTAFGYQQPTPIQQALIPVLLSGQDASAIAPTGTGKTAAYVLPILHYCLDQKRSSAGQMRRPTLALIVLPTRELVQQVQALLEQAIAALKGQTFTPLKSVAVYGGVSINPQLMNLRGGTDILVATPGRLLDCVDHNAVALTHLHWCVLDEADKLLDQGFSQELLAINALLPTQRQTVLISASDTASAQQQAVNWLKHPSHIHLQDTQNQEHPQSVPDIDNAVATQQPLAQQNLVQQRALWVNTSARTAVLKQCLASWQNTATSGLTVALQPRVLVFVASQYAANTLTGKLLRAGVQAAPFHGELSQGQRTQTLADFKAKRIDCLICTDLAARGIDIAQLEIVVNYDLPRSPNDYVHRIGRTGRAGEKGLALSMVSPDSLAHWQLLCKRNHLDVELETLPDFAVTDSMPTAVQNAQSVGTGGIKGKRPSKKDKLRAAGLRPMPQS